MSVDDTPTLEGFIYGEMPSKRAVYNVIDALFSYVKVEGANDSGHNESSEDPGANSGKEQRFIEYSNYDMCFEHDIRDTCLGQLIAQLDLSENLIEETTPFFSVLECGIPAKINERRFPPPDTPAGRVVAASVAKSRLLHVDMREVSKATGLKYGQISRFCDDLMSQGVFSKVNSKKLIHHARVKKMPTDIGAIADRMYNLLMVSRDRQVDHLRLVVDFYSTSTCQTRFLATHLRIVFTFKLVLFQFLNMNVACLRVAVVRQDHGRLAPSIRVLLVELVVGNIKETIFSMFTAKRKRSQCSTQRNLRRSASEPLH